MSKEALSRIKIDELLKNVGWRFFENEKGRVNAFPAETIIATEIEKNDTGEDIEAKKSYEADYVLYNTENFPIAVLEAKKFSIHPLIAKEQARNYAIHLGKHCQYIILSNGKTHYLWNLNKGNPKEIEIFPTQAELMSSNIKFKNKKLNSVEKFDSIPHEAKKFNPEDLINLPIADDFIAKTQNAKYSIAPEWRNETFRAGFIEKNKLTFLRPFQLEAVQAIQKAVATGKNRFLFEMATGTGKTLTAAAVIKLFYISEAATRILFLVDRIELEEQAVRAFKKYLKTDLRCVIYKESRNNSMWRNAEIVVTTVQTLVKNNRYKSVFMPTDFGLVIADEAHRAINGIAREVFEYFHGFKLGLTATPKNYLNRFDNIADNDPRELERRTLLDTYAVFGCENGEPTFSYTLIDGVRDGFLVNPKVVDARTHVTTQLLSDRGLSVVMHFDEETPMHDSDGSLGSVEAEYRMRDFEKTFFSEHTNEIFCKTFLDHALCDPISGEIGKTIVFCVRQIHATKIVQILNRLADKMFPGKYQSNFAVQVTSQIPEAQKFTTQFTHNKLMGYGNFFEDYRTSKARVCVTVGMMTTGYDCPDLLNVCLMRPIFSPTEFIQIKGRGTRKFDFRDKDYLLNPERGENCKNSKKTGFKLFDFFANCEYFEEHFNYDEILKLPISGDISDIEITEERRRAPEYNSNTTDALTEFAEIQIGTDGMRVDREFSSRRKKEELLSEAFDIFKTQTLTDTKDLQAAEDFFTAYITDTQFRQLLDAKDFQEFYTNQNFDAFEAYKKLPQHLRDLIPNYIKENISLQDFLF